MFSYRLYHRSISPVFSLLFHEILVNRLKTWTLLSQYMMPRCEMKPRWVMMWPSNHPLVSKGLFQAAFGIRQCCFSSNQDTNFSQSSKLVFCAFLPARCWLNILYLHVSSNLTNETVRRPLFFCIFFFWPKTCSEMMSWISPTTEVSNHLQTFCLFYVFHLRILVAWAVAPHSLVLRRFGIQRCLASC